MAFWSNFGGVGDPELTQKIDFRAFFVDVIFESVLTSKKKALESNLDIDLGSPKPPKLFQNAM